MIALSAVAALPAMACGPDTTPLFACEAANGRKFIELCASSPLTAAEGELRYRFGSLDGSGQPKATELVFPSSAAGSLARFVGATYTHEGIYTKSVRFVSGEYSYTVFTRAKGSRDLGAGVDVRNLRTGKTATVACSERPRFYIHELKGLLACDKETPVGTACIQ